MSSGRGGAGGPIGDRDGITNIRRHWGRYLAMAVFAFIAGEFAAASIGTGTEQRDPMAAGESHADLPRDEANNEKGGIE